MDTENVKERLNTLLHKKITELEKDSTEQQQQYKVTEQQQPSTAVSIKTESDGDKKSQSVSPEIQDGLDCVAKEQVTKSFLLHEILNEKKKALLQDKEVMMFFQNKIK